MSIKIDQAFTSAILSGGLALDVVHENGIYSEWGGAAYTSKEGPYTPDQGHIEITTFPAGTEPLSLNNSDEAVGLFQAIIKYPVDTASIIAKQKAEALLALFPIGTAIIYDGQKVYPVSKNRDGGRVEGGFYQIVVRVNYRAFISR